MERLQKQSQARESQLREQSFDVLYSAVLEKPLHKERNAAPVEILAENSFVDLRRWAGRPLGS